MKKWWQCIDGAKLVALIFIWISAWLFMLPCQAEINSPYFDNIWGSFFLFFGISKKQNFVIYQKPDLISSLISLVFIFILWTRKIITSFIYTKNRNVNMISCIISIIIHAFFLSVLTKVLFFPQTGVSSTGFLEIAKNNISIVVLSTAVFCFMAFGPKSTSAIAFAVLFFFCIIKNIKVVSDLMGDAAFIAILFSVIGFYLDFYSIGLNKMLFFSDLNYLFDFNLRNDRSLLFKDGKIFVPLEDSSVYASGAQSVREIYKKQHKMKNFFRVKNKKLAICLIVISLFLFFFMPFMVIRQMFLMKSGWNGIFWNSTESQVKEWVKKNNNSYLYRQCPYSHFGVKCYLLSWKSEIDDTIEFQFRNSKLFCVVENGVAYNEKESEKLNKISFYSPEQIDKSFFGISEDASFLENLAVSSKLIKKNGKKIIQSDEVFVFEENGFFDASVQRTFLLMRTLCNNESVDTIEKNLNDFSVDLKEKSVLSYRIVRQTFKKSKENPLYPDFKEYSFD